MAADLAKHRGSILAAQSKYDDALAVYLDALRLAESKLGAEDPRLYPLLYNISAVYDDKGDRERARKFATRARDMVAKGYGDRHPGVADALNLLAILDAKRNDNAGSLIKFQHVLALRRDTLGSSHPRVASAMNNVGIILRRLGRLGEASASFQTAYRIWRASLGDNHPNITPPLNNLGDTALLQGRLSDAQAAFTRSLAIIDRILGTSSPRARAPLIGLVKTAHRRKDREQLVRWCGRLRAIAATASEVKRWCESRK